MRDLRRVKVGMRRTFCDVRYVLFHRHISAEELTERKDAVFWLSGVVIV